MSTNPDVRPPLDPELAAVVPAVRALLEPYSDTSLPRLRTLIADGFPGMPPLDLTAGGTVAVTERVVPGPTDAPEITLLVLAPATGSGPWPCIYHIHGGGMVVGNRRTGIDYVLPYVADLGVVVVSVEYRLAPENPDPAPVEDCYAGLVWTAMQAGELDIDPNRILIVGGSAGAGLAAGSALLARDRGFPALTHQILISPMLDDRFETPSSRMLDGDGIWDRNDNRYGWTCLLGDRLGGPDVSIYAAPARATDLSGLPHTYIDVGTVETFRDEAITYAHRLAQAGATLDFHLWGGAFHGFEGAAPHAAISRASKATRDEFFRRALEG